MSNDGLDGTWQIMHRTIHRGVFVCGGRMLIFNDTDVLVNIELPASKL